MFGHRSVLLLLVVLVVECFAFDWKSCGTGEAKFSVKDVTLTPEPVSPGSTAVFTINATSGVPVQAGQISMTVQYAGFPIWTQEDSLCTKMTCPATAGPVAVVFQQQFPVITPPGQYVVTLKGTSSESEELFCVEVTFQVIMAWGLTKPADQAILRTNRRLLTG